MQTWKRPAPSAEGKPGAGAADFATCKPGQYTPRNHKPQRSALVRALLDVPEIDRPALTNWAVARLGVDR